MMSSTVLKPTFTGPRVPVTRSSRAAPSRIAIFRVRAGPYDEELIQTAVRSQEPAVQNVPCIACWKRGSSMTA